MEVPDAARPATDFDVRSILHEEIDRLVNRHRMPVVFCDLDGLTYEQAAGRLHCTVPTLYHRLTKARRRLRERLIRRRMTARTGGHRAGMVTGIAATQRRFIGMVTGRGGGGNQRADPRRRWRHWSRLSSGACS